MCRPSPSPEAAAHPVRTDSALPRDEVIAVTMTTSGGEEIRQEFTLPAMSRLQDALVWRPKEPGKMKLTLSIPLTGGGIKTS